MIFNQPFVLAIVYKTSPLNADVGVGVGGHTGSLPSLPHSSSLSWPQQSPDFGTSVHVVGVAACTLYPNTLTR